jgi:hypothetical protein
MVTRYLWRRGDECLSFRPCVAVGSVNSSRFSRKLRSTSVGTPSVLRRAGQSIFPAKAPDYADTISNDRVKARATMRRYTTLSASNRKPQWLAASTIREG